MCGHYVGLIIISFVTIPQLAENVNLHEQLVCKGRETGGREDAGYSSFRKTIMEEPSGRYFSIIPDFRNPALA